MTPPQEACLRNLHALVNDLKAAVDSRSGETVIELVERYNAITDELLKSPLEAKGAGEIRTLTQLSEEIINLQAEVQQLAAPWISDLRILLRENKTERALNNTYRTEP